MVAAIARRRSITAVFASVFQVGAAGYWAPDRTDGAWILRPARLSERAFGVNCRLSPDPMAGPQVTLRHRRHRPPRRESGPAPAQGQASASGSSCGRRTTRARLTASTSSVRTATSAIRRRPAPRCSGCRRVYHCAAKISITTGAEREIYETNVLGTRNVLAAAARAGVARVGSDGFVQRCRPSSGSPESTNAIPSIRLRRRCRTSAPRRLSSTSA